jgi:hypothetical protein
MANIFTSLLHELPWFEREREEHDRDTAEARAEQAELRKPKPYVPKTRPEDWLPS